MGRNDKATAHAEPGAAFRNTTAIACCSPLLLGVATEMQEIC